MHLAYIWIVSHLSAKNYRNLWKFDEVLTKTNLLSFFGTRCSLYGLVAFIVRQYLEKKSRISTTTL